LLIGKVEIVSPFALAPMAGITDGAFRMLCRQQGAALACTEMVSAKALCYNDKKTASLLYAPEGDSPLAVQIFGSDPEHMAKGAVIALALSGAQIVDINMGCPTPKIVKNGDGCALMRDLKLAGRIIEAVARAVDAPVTVKMRLGWDEQSKNAAELICIARACGAAGVCVHARTAAQMYAGKADVQALKRLRAGTDLFFIANGAATDARAAAALLTDTGADMVMIGRAAMGDPWIFSRARAVLSGEPEPEPPSVGQRMDAALRQFEQMLRYKSEKRAALEMRKHLAWYLKGIKNASALKSQATRVKNEKDVYAVAQMVRAQL